MSRAVTSMPAVGEGGIGRQRKSGTLDEETRLQGGKISSSFFPDSVTREDPFTNFSLDLGMEGGRKRRKMNGETDLKGSSRKHNPKFCFLFLTVWKLGCLLHIWLLVCPWRPSSSRQYICQLCICS